MRQWKHSTLAIGDIRVYFQIRPVLGVGCFPLLLVPLELTTVPDKRCLGGQCQHLGFLRAPIIVHALSILGVAHQTAHVQLTINLELVTNHPHNRDERSSPFTLLQNLIAVGLAPLDSLTIRLPGAQRLAEHRPQQAVLGGAGERCLIAGIQIECRLFTFDVEILSNTHSGLTDPLIDR